MNKIQQVIFISIFLLIGVYFTLLGIYPISIEIKPIGNTIEAQIHKKSIIPPFNDVSIVISNLKQAVIGSSRSSKGGVTYRVELESYTGKNTPITSYYSSGYKAKAILQDNINKAISTKKEYNCLIKQYGFLIFGFSFILIPSIILFFVIRTDNNNINKYNQRNKQRKPYVYKEQQPIYSTEEEKFKDINNSIIK